VGESGKGNGKVKVRDNVLPVNLLPYLVEAYIASTINNKKIYRSHNMQENKQGTKPTMTIHILLPIIINCRKPCCILLLVVDGIAPSI